MESRRSILKGISVGVGAGVLAPMATRDARAAVDPAHSPADLLARAEGDAGDVGSTPSHPEAQANHEAVAARPAPWALLAPLSAGSELGAGWRLHALSAVEHGAFVITLATIEAATARVHVCRNGGQPRGLAHTEALDLLLMNGGDGGTPSQEQLGRILIGLAALMDRNRDAATAAHPELSELLTHDERLQRFADTDSEVLS